MKKTMMITVILAICFSVGISLGAIDNPKLIKLPMGFGPHRIENTPVIYQGRPILIENSRLTNEVDPSNVFDGLIDDVKLYNRALSEKEISWLFKAILV